MICSNCWRWVSALSAFATLARASTQPTLWKFRRHRRRFQYALSAGAHRRRHVYFTVVTYKRKPIFKDADSVALLQKSIADVRAAHPFEIPAQVILHDHLHAIWTLPEGDSDFPMRWRQIKAAFTRTMDQNDDAIKSKSRISKGERTLWQRRYREHVIRGDADYTAHVEYIHFNPVKYGLAARPRDWPHSTFHDWVARGLYDLTWAADVAPDFSSIEIVE
jgi:putative transposase